MKGATPPPREHGALNYSRDPAALVPTYRRWLGGVMIAGGATLIGATILERGSTRVDMIVAGGSLAAWGAVVLFQHVEFRFRRGGVTVPVKVVDDANPSTEPSVVSGRGTLPTYRKVLVGVLWGLGTAGLCTLPFLGDPSPMATVGVTSVGLLLLGWVVAEQGRRL